MGIREYIDGSHGTWFKEHCIEHQTILARSPQSNGVSERMNRTVQDRGKSMLAGLGGGFAKSSYTRNKGPVAGLIKTPDELRFGIIPSVKLLRAYGSKAYVRFRRRNARGRW